MKLFALLLLSLGAVEGFAFWWMHPEPTGLRQPLLVYRPSRSAGVPPASQKSETEEQRAEIELDDSSLSISPSQSFNVPAFHSTHTPLPEIVARSIPSLRCTTGTAARIDRDDGVTIHLAFFEWDQTSSTHVLEAYKHLPEECMGTIGMTLLEKAPLRSYPIGKENLSFDHTVFRDPGGSIIHAFKGTWVSGASTLLGAGLRGGGDQARQIRSKAALNRFRPAYARVAQGAVRGISDPDRAWQAFEQAMLKDLVFQ
jgi:hypothetical protein